VQSVECGVHAVVHAAHRTLYSALSHHKPTVPRLFDFSTFDL